LRRQRLLCRDHRPASRRGLRRGDPSARRSRGGLLHRAVVTSRPINGSVHAMGLLQWLRLRSAAKRYSRSLGPALRRDYGASEFYTPPQIRATARRLDLPEAFIDLGYAAFLPEAAFDEVAIDRQPGRRQALIKLIRRYQPRMLPAGSWNPAEDTVGAMGGL